MDNKILIALVAVGGGALLLLRKQIGGIMSIAMDEASKAIFKATLPARAQPYGDLILQVASETGVSPLLLFAIMDRESLCGEALSPRGPSGTGDSGHGRGLMQIDDRAYTSWVNANAWWEPLVNIRKGADIIKQTLSFFKGKTVIDGLTDGATVTVEGYQASRRGAEEGEYTDPRPLSGDDLWNATIAAYNTGVGNVLMSLAVGVSVDTTTANGDYSADAISRLTTLALAIENAGGSLTS